MSTGVVWFRRDLRLHDNPAWAAATRAHREVLPLFVLDPRLVDRAGEFRRAAVFNAVAGLDQSLRELGARLHVVSGDPSEMVPTMVGALTADAIYINRDVTPYATARDEGLERSLPVPLRASWGSVIRPPGSVLTADGTVPRVFSAFWRRWQQEPLPKEAVAKPRTLLTLDACEPIPAAGCRTEDDARARLDVFVDDRLAAYPEDRDLPAVDGTSALSVDLKVGTLSPAEAARTAAIRGPTGDPFIRQLAWRDWYAHLLFEEPRLMFAPQRPEYARIRWRNDPAEFAAWKTGQTGFPIVDAGMRELNITGLMHNRVRMIAASFLVKDLLVDWHLGEQYFRHVLADGDVSQNVGNWQWVAGTGPDAAPYFRVFNPTLQSERFDANGAYIRRWVPELASLDDRAIHNPSKLGPLDLAAAGITLGVDYPFPLVDHAMARVRAIDTYKRARA